MSYKKLQKGSVIGYDWYYVVVDMQIHDGELYLGCICDNANNQYSFSIKEILETKEPHGWLVLSPLKAVEVASWDDIGSLDEDDQRIYNRLDRSIPLDIMAEVLAGKHDHRFES